MSVISSVLSIFDWFKDKLPLQDRKERWRNEYDSIKKERADILIHKADVQKAKRMEYLDNRMRILEQLFRNQQAK